VEQQVTQEQAEQRVFELMTQNGAEIERLSVVPKGRGVWLATATLTDNDEERQGIFTDDQLV
jgi:hypothetical protein